MFMGWLLRAGGFLTPGGAWIRLGWVQGFNSFLQTPPACCRTAVWTLRCSRLETQRLLPPRQPPESLLDGPGMLSWESLSLLPALAPLGQGQC